MRVGAVHARRVVAAVAGASALWAASASAGDKPPTAIGVRNGVSEFSFALSRTRVDPGPALVQYQNTGEDPHDLKIRRIGGESILEIGVTEPGLVGSISIARLRPDSRYRLWCSLDGHAESGMEAVLKVRERR